jgi:hypothetical protein
VIDKLLRHSLVAACFAAPLVAWNAPAALAQEHEAAEHVEHAEAEHHEYHKNYLFLFLGGTTESIRDESETFFSAGLTYERRLSQLIGLGIGGEFVFGDEGREALAGLLFILHPIGGLGLAVGPGLEVAKESHGEEGHEEEETSTHAALRVGATYEFEVGEQFAVAPAVYVDFVDGKDPVLVWGLEFGLGF